MDTNNKSIFFIKHFVFLIIFIFTSKILAQNNSEMQCNLTEFDKFYFESIKKYIFYPKFSKSINLNDVNNINFPKIKGTGKEAHDLIVLLHNISTYFNIKKYLEHEKSFIKNRTLKTYQDIVNFRLRFFEYLYYCNTNQL